MVEVAATVPINNIKRRTIFAIRDFPKGCGIKVIPNPNPPPPLLIESDSIANDVNVEATSKLKEEIRVSDPNESDNHQVESAQNGNLGPPEGVNVNGQVKVNGHVKEGPCNSGKNSVGNVVDEPSNSKGFVVNKRRKVWAVRDFPVGCGRGASKVVKGPVASSESRAIEDESEVGLIASSKRKAVDQVRMSGDKGKGLDVDELKVGKGPVASSKSKAIDDDLEAGLIASSKWKVVDEARTSGDKGNVLDVVESFEKAEDDELIGKTVNETKGEAIVKALKATSLSGEKKKPATKLEGEVKRNESVQSQAKIKEASREDEVKSSGVKSLDAQKKQVANQEKAVEGSVRVSSELKKIDSKKIKPNAQDSSSEVRNKPLLKNSSSKNMLEENREKKPLSQSSSEKKLAGSDGKHDGDNHQANESREVRSPSGVKIADKAGRSLAGKPVDKGAVSSPKDGKNIKKRKFPDDEGNKSLEASGDRLIVQALMSSKNCPWRKGRKSGGIISRSFTPKTKTKKVTKSSGSNSPSLRKTMVDMDDDEDSLPQDQGNEKALVIHGSPRELCVTMTPSIPSRLSSKGNNSNEEVVNRNMVKKVLRLFQLITRKLIQGEEKSKGKETKSKDNSKKRVDLDAARILKENNEWVNYGEPIIGHVPGVEVGDEFHFRVELSIIGIHRPFQGGIDFTKRNGVVLAMSIVASGGYPDDVDNADILIYSGSGGNASGSGDKQAGDQKLERGNLALKNSIDAQTPVRVIYGSKELSKGDSRDAKSKMVSTFTYDGLYVVEKYWPERGTNNFIVYKFQLRKMPGQPEIALKEIKKAKKSKVREGLCMKDISNGKENIPICAVNTVDNELPMPFKYINKVIYPSSYVKRAPKGCDCTNGCSDSENCACAVKNGGEIPYNFNGAIVQAKVLVYECGPSCKCPPSCHNRVSQHGIQLPLEIFKTSTRGWGVRSLYSIPSGTFVCEYLGEMLQDAEAEQRTNDEYLFDIGHNYDDHNLWDGLPSFVPGMLSDAAHETVEDVGFTIDAAKCGNVGRFINHSCSPNLYAQNVLYDHDEKKMPHVMFFAIDNIPPLQELTYHYNYTLDQVRDSEGNIKTKDCFCGSPECTGRLY